MAGNKVREFNMWGEDLKSLTPDQQLQAKVILGIFCHDFSRGISKKDSMGGMKAYADLSTPVGMTRAKGYLLPEYQPFAGLLLTINEIKEVFSALMNTKYPSNIRGKEEDNLVFNLLTYSCQLTFNIFYLLSKKIQDKTIKLDQPKDRERYLELEKNRVQPSQVFLNGKKLYGERILFEEGLSIFTYRNVTEHTESKVKEVKYGVLLMTDIAGTNLVNITDLSAESITSANSSKRRLIGRVQQYLCSITDPEELGLLYGNFHLVAVNKANKNSLIIKEMAKRYLDLLQSSKEVFDETIISDLLYIFFPDNSENHYDNKALIKKIHNELGLAFLKDYTIPNNQIRSALLTAIRSLVVDNLKDVDKKSSEFLKIVEGKVSSVLKILKLGYLEKNTEERDLLAQQEKLDEESVVILLLAQDAVEKNEELKNMNVVNNIPKDVRLLAWRILSTREKELDQLQLSDNDIINLFKYFPSLTFSIFNEKTLEELYEQEAKRLQEKYLKIYHQNAVKGILGTRYQDQTFEHVPITPGGDIYILTEKSHIKIQKGLKWENFRYGLTIISLLSETLLKHLKEGEKEEVIFLTVADINEGFDVFNSALK